MTERELSRGAARRLAMIQHVEEVTGNVAMTCRYFGISRQRYYFLASPVSAAGACGPARAFESAARESECH